MFVKLLPVKFTNIYSSQPSLYFLSTKNYKQIKAVLNTFVTITAHKMLVKLTPVG